MSKIIEQIEKIREINKQHKLVIFVGAGVSKNSGVCSWWELVKDMAVEINYNDICEKCKMRNLICNECGENLELCSFDNYNCQYKYNFSSDEFLKIPQFFYDIKGKDEYYSFLDKKFNQDYKPNVIDELIITLNPEHIITTNYDHLIEDVKHLYRSNYTTIRNDMDMLKKYGNNYIIKMHGDIDDKENIVLKEDDYLKYSHTHKIIESYIKSLLFDKTFLFIGYSLNDNNLKLIMSYIDYYVKEKEIKGRTNHYLILNNPKKRAEMYWKNKDVELIDLSQISDFMKEHTECNINELGKPLYTFLRYVKDDRLPYSNDEISVLKKSLFQNLKSLNVFNYISYSTLLQVCHFSNPVDNINGSLAFSDKKEYTNLKSVLGDNSNESKTVKESFIKSGITSIYYIKDNNMRFDLPIGLHSTNILFELSLNNKYSEIVQQLKDYPDNLEKAYYYFLIYQDYENKCQDIMSGIEKVINSLDYNNLTDEEKYKIAVFEFNSISIRLLNFHSDNRDKWNRLDELLETASKNNKAFDFIKTLCGNNGEMLNKLNSFLMKHEEYYMKKSTMAKWGGTIHGVLFKLKAIAYDYYLFYKKNFLMLDWFNNVQKVCAPYIKAILCTYYPDKYQYSRKLLLGRTQVEPYPLTLIDIDMIVKHTKYKDFCSWISYYKVFSVNIEEGIDISELFEDFCISTRMFFNIHLFEQNKVFCKLISLVDLNEEQKHRIIEAFISLVKPDEKIGIEMMRNSLNALWIYVQKHYDKNDSSYDELLSLLINIEIAKDPLDGMMVYKNLINILLPNADEKIYESCCRLIYNNTDGERVKALLGFIYRKILLKFDYQYWQKWIVKHIEHNWTEEVYKYLQEGIILYDECINDYFQNTLKKHSKPSNAMTIPNNKLEIIDSLVVLLLDGKIPNIQSINFLQKYSDEYDYINFLFNPDSFDYSKINIADYMWCNLINDNKYRELIISHKNEFWHKDDEKRILLGFGSDFENRVAYKYLID